MNLPVTRKRSNLESSRAAACQRRKKKLAVEAEALAKSTRHDDDPDRISELPDKIIYHILSFLDMKHVIHTAFLSKRWTTIFKSLPTLSLNQNSYQEMILGNEIYDDIHSVEFIDFVNNVLVLRDAATNVDNNSIIHSLRISCFDENMNIDHINTWVDFAARHNVQELDFTLAIHDTTDLPLLNQHPLSLSIFSLFSCKLLTTLNLGSSAPDVIIPHDLVVDLPNLKTLDLINFYFHGETINENFFSRCPVLERLIITSCHPVDGPLNIIVSEDHQLKYLKIDSLHILKRQLPFHITISAPKLTSLSIRDDQNEEFFGEYNLVNIHSLIKARMDSYEEVDTRDLMKFLNGICNVKSLTLSAALIQGHDGGCFKYLLNPFHNLRVLKLLMNTSFERDQIRAIAYLLEKCPNVETLALKMSPVRIKEQPHKSATIVDKECGEAELSSLQFKLDQLKFTDQDQIQGFTGCRNECREAELSSLQFKLDKLKFTDQIQGFTGCPNECGEVELSSLQFKLDKLKFIEIRGFTGCRNELEFLIFMLVHTPMLEKMVIFAHKKHLSTRNRETYRAMLEASPRTSSRTEFLIL